MPTENPLDPLPAGSVKRKVLKRDSKNEEHKKLPLGVGQLKEILLEKFDVISGLTTD